MMLWGWLCHSRSIDSSPSVCVEPDLSAEAGLVLSSCSPVLGAQDHCHDQIQGLKWHRAWGTRESQREGRASETKAGRKAPLSSRPILHLPSPGSLPLPSLHGRNNPLGLERRVCNRQFLPFPCPFTTKVEITVLGTAFIWNAFKHRNFMSS